MNITPAAGADHGADTVWCTSVPDCADFDGVRVAIPGSQVVPRNGDNAPLAIINCYRFFGRLKKANARGDARPPRQNAAPQALRRLRRRQPHGGCVAGASPQRRSRGGDPTGARRGAVATPKET